MSVSSSGILLILVSAWIGGSVRGALLTVTDAADSGAGSLREAIASAAPGDTVDFDPALDGVTIILAGTHLEIDKALVIDASGLPGGLVIDADEGSRAVFIDGSHAVTLRNLTLTGGRTPEPSDPNGGGIHNAGGSLTLEFCTITGNATGAGAATGNAGGRGGGIYSVNGTLTLDFCEVTGNATGAGGDQGDAGGIGGGIYSGGGDVTLNDSALDGNTTGAGATGAVSRGGGIYLSGGTLELHRSSVLENQTAPGGSGGGMFLDGTTIAVNTTVAGNACGGLGNGGGAFKNSGTLTLRSCTVADNEAGGGTGRGGGIYNFSGSFLLINSIVATNSAPGGGFDLWGPYTVNGNNVVILSNSPATVPAGANAPLAGDPRLGPLGDHGGPTRTMPLRNGSVALDAAVGSSPDTDQRGQDRGPFGPADLGAYEAGDRTFVVTTRDDEVDGLDVNEVSLREALVDGEPYSTITFDPSVFSTAQHTIVLQHGPLEVAGQVEIDASGTDTGVVVDAQQNSRVMEILAGVLVVELRHLTLTGGHAILDGPPAGLEGVGGGILAWGAGIHTDLRLFDCVISENRADLRGGGIACSGTLWVTSSSVSDNQAVEFEGGGIYNGAGELTAEDSSFTGNSAGGDGGGIHTAGEASFVRCELAGNASDGRGGGIYAYSVGVSITMTEGEVRNNASDSHGGGVCLSGGASLDSSASTFSGNQAQGSGGAIAADGSASVTAAGSTLYGNTAVGDGGGIGIMSLLSLCEIRSSTLSGNQAGGAGGAIDAAVAVTIDSSIVAGNGTPGLSGVPALIDAHSIIGGDPRLAPLGDYGGPTWTMPPLPDSPAIDQGASAEPFDQRGLPRNVDGDGAGGPAVDAGAVEYDPAIDPAAYWALDWDGDGVPYGVEQAVGTDPLAGDAGHARSFGRIAAGAGGGSATLRFGIDPAADPRTLWIVERSPDLSPGSWVEVYRFVGATGTGDPQPGISAAFGSPPLDPEILLLTDEAPPSPLSFYRLGTSLDGPS